LSFKLGGLSLRPLSSRAPRCTPCSTHMLLHAHTTARDAPSGSIPPGPPRVVRVADHMFHNAGALPAKNSHFSAIVLPALRLYWPGFYFRMPQNQAPYSSRPSTSLKVRPCTQMICDGAFVRNGPSRDACPLRPRTLFAGGPGATAVPLLPTLFPHVNPFRDVRNPRGCLAQLETRTCRSAYSVAHWRSSLCPPYLRR